jgi:hypothetical protein
MAVAGIWVDVVGCNENRIAGVFIRIGCNICASGAVLAGVNSFA